ncbi:MAG TPA: energy transducer TonB [Verrucomicrobiae bacterium]|nr:energy transducer TonB [Verrucomicrobiae bacterium]
MPGFINLLPKELSNPKRSGAEEVIPVPKSALPDFGAPAHLMPNDFWSNLKQFLLERPVKIIERTDVPFTRNSFGSGLSENLKFFLSGPKVRKGPINKRLEVDWGGNFGGFVEQLKEFFSPTRAVMPAGIKPVQVKEIWSKDENFGWTQAIALAAHAIIIALLIVPFITNMLPSTTQAKNKLDVTPLDISPYVAKLPAGNNKAGGGGGANDHTNTPVNKGRPPRFTMTQFAAPTLHPNPQPKLAMEATLLGPPDLKVSSVLTNLGDPMAAGPGDSLGHGDGTGIGSGTGGGLGPGEGGGTGGGMFRAGVNGVGLPTCFYMPNPPYSDEARKAKYSGVVLVEAVITVDGRVTNPRVIKSPGLGLDESTTNTMRTWRCKPVTGPNGKPVPVLVPFEVTFRLY